MKKVLFLAASNKFSGAENVISTIITNLNSSYEGIYCCPSGPIKEQLDDLNINYLFLKKFSFFQFKKVLLEYKPDIIHAHDYRACLLASLFCKKYKLVAHIHVNHNMMKSKNIFSFVVKLCLKKFDNIIWVSDSAYDSFSYKDNFKKNSTILYNVIDTNKINNKIKNDNINDKFDLIFLGRLSIQKNPLRFIEIIKKLKEKKNSIKVAIVGDGDLKDDIVNKINEYNLSDNITMFGFLSNPYSVLNNSKILVMTSDWEGTPMVSLEAMSLGKPIISTPVDGMKKVIIDDYNGFISDNNDDFVKKILYCLDKKYSDLSSNSLKRFKELNDINAYMNYIYDIYDGD